MNRALCFAIVFVGAFAITVPAFAAAEWPPIVSNYVAAVRKTVTAIDAKGYLAVVKKPKGALILDVREPAEFAAGHVPGAVNIPRGVLEFKIYEQLGYPKKVDTERRIYVQCATGDRAALAAAALNKIGFKNVTAAVFNWADWVKAGNPNIK